MASASSSVGTVKVAAPLSFTTTVRRPLSPLSTTLPLWLTCTLTLRVSPAAGGGATLTVKEAGSPSTTALPPLMLTLGKDCTGGVTGFTGAALTTMLKVSDDASATAGWQVRFGRTVAQQVVTAVQGRFTTTPQRA